MGNESNKKMSMENDLGATVSDNLSPEKHINRIVVEKVAFKYLDEEMMKKLIVTVIRPRLEYEATVWSPSTNLNVSKVARIQREATKLVPRL